MYTALGGLRGVVWTDCFQAILIILSPVTVISKVVYDSTYKNMTLRPLWDIKANRYFLNTTLDFTKDENLWASLIGLFSFSMYRCYMDQIAAQRYLAAKTLQDAKKIVCIGTLLTNLGYMLICLIGISLTYWFRDCDPQLTGEIGRPDQILPFYVSVYLNDFPGFPGIFLAGVVGATTRLSRDTFVISM
ncbi:sodium/iodide cotransporter-like [Ixodes scapularis]|uniref:sodium/iodide cotransporter-like n=1 Tax=Ixodes scapularis TaxID=6945 RepID=UPI001C394800|nr:sodium/iodide cotransporter-like [Ixodes scapularis]